MTKTDDFSKVVSTLMEAVTLEANGTLKVVNQKAMDTADELLGSLIVEMARDWWAQLESTEESLAGMADEISFSELNADPSHVTATPIKTAAKPASVSATMEAALGGPEFDLRGIFEMAEDEFDGAPVDGDEGYDDLLRGDDDAGVGDGAPVDGDDELDSDDDLDAMGAQGGDDLELGSTTDLDLDGGFDFSFLDDQSDDLGGDFGGEPDGDLGGDFGGEQGDDLGGEFNAGFEDGEYPSDDDEQSDELAPQ